MSAIASSAFTGLGELCEFVRGVGFDSGVASTVPRPGDVPILRAGNIQDQLLLNEDLIWVPSELVSEEQRLRVGDIAICMSSGSASIVGKTARLLSSWVGSVGAFCGILRPRRLEQSAYLYFWLQSAAFKDWRDGMARGSNIQNLRFSELSRFRVFTPSQEEQKRIATALSENMASAGFALAHVRAQRDGLRRMITALLRESLAGEVHSTHLASCLAETNRGVGASWDSYPVLGATRAGLALAKEPVGKQPQRYKLVGEGTIFYNPMRILLGSIAMVDKGDAPGITSPDYVAFKCDANLLDYRWFYYWLRSPFGEQFIKGLTRGAVRERLLFKRLAAASVELPPIERQRKVAEKLPLIRHAINRIDEQVSLTENLFPAYLRCAFAGAP